MRLKPSIFQLKQRKVSCFGGGATDVCGASTARVELSAPGSLNSLILHLLPGCRSQTSLQLLLNLQEFQPPLPVQCNWEEQDLWTWVWGNFVLEKRELESQYLEEYGFEDKTLWDQMLMEEQILGEPVEEQ